MDERKIVITGIFFSLFIHIITALVFYITGESVDAAAIKFPSSENLCGDGRRCNQQAFRFGMRRIDDTPLADVGIIVAALIPRLGLKQEAKWELPKFVKYEQPEKIEDAINISEENLKKEDVKNKEFQQKKAQIDKTRKKNDLASILNAPDDDDPRKRATKLENIIGSADGSVFGTGAETSPGNIYAGKVSAVVRQQFKIPSFITDSDLKKLLVRVKITKLTQNGEIVSFEIMESSQNSHYNSAALAAIKKFVPKEGGGAKLPQPDIQTLNYINSKGMIIDLDGRLFKK